MTVFLLLTARTVAGQLEHMGCLASSHMHVVGTALRSIVLAQASELQAMHCTGQLVGDSMPRCKPGCKPRMI
jgi:hypothetical protein